jgi:hypothetical protein
MIGIDPGEFPKPEPNSYIQQASGEVNRFEAVAFFMANFSGG